MLGLSIIPDNRSIALPRRPADVPLRATGLACRRGGRLLFEGLDLVVEAGSVVWLRGANGSGKTSLLRLLAGIARPDEGRVQCSIARLYVAHANALKDDLTVAESLAFLARLHGQHAASLPGALARFGLVQRADAPVRTLSQGQRRRVALARLALEPAAALWLLDEPFDALDADGATVLGALLREHAKRGGAAVLASHLAPALDGLAPVAFDLDAAAGPR
jgi:heme exporter protein A